MPVTQQQHWEYTTEEWSKGEFKDLLDKLPEIKVLYDIGANVGGFSQIFLNKFLELKVYAWEPYKPNYDYLITKIKAICFQEGIFYGKTEAKLLGRGDGNIGGLFIEHLDLGLPRVSVSELIILKELESYKIPKPDLIKMDVEGAEENIIEHSKIVKECPNLIIEWHNEKNNYLDFFNKHLPNHEIKAKAGDSNYLLCLKSQ